MSDYKVSIIMPVYNAEKFLRDTLDSIVNQSIGVENLEVVIVNDASTDRSGDIIDEYCAKYPNFKAIHLKENVGGPHIPRNIAFRHTTADYIMFLDADDTYTPTACEALYNEISSGDADAVVGRYWRVYDDCRLISYSPYDPKVNDIKVYPKFSRGLGFVWTRILYPILYGRPLEYSDRVVIDDVHENPEILKMLPAIWTKIIRREKFAPFKEFTAGGGTVIVTTHDVDFCARTAGRCAMLFDGQITGEGPAGRFFRYSAAVRNHSLSSPVWFSTRSMMTWISRFWHSAMKVSKSSRVPYWGSMS